MNLKEYISNIRKKVKIEEIQDLIGRFKNLKILVIGDTIVDQYVFVRPKGRAIKDPILSAEYIRHETYAGGILAVVNHLSSYVNNIELVTIIGDEKTKLKFIEENISSNVNLKTFVKDKSPTTLKKRFIDEYRNNKLFKIEYINDKPITSQLSKEIETYLSNKLPEYNLVIVADFGHGFINDEIRRCLERNSKYLAINVQSNSANMGFNYVNHYKKIDYLTLNDTEIRLPLMMRFNEINEVIQNFNDKFKYDHFLVTLGKNGSVYYKNSQMYKSPVIIKNVIDTVGSGDALFAISSLFAYLDADPELIPFVANVAGGIKANYMGNKESVTKEKLISFLDKLYENGME